MTNKITVIIHTYNEEGNIEECIKSAKLLTDDVILIDTESTDKTVPIAKALGIRTYGFKRSFYVEPSREFGIEKAGGEWVLILDADERITKELAKEILGALKGLSSGGDSSPTKGGIRMTTHFKVPRKNIFAGKKWLQHGGWYPDHQMRLIKKSAFVSWPAVIHATPKINGEMEYLKEPFLHLFHPNLSNMVAKTAIFEEIESELLFKAGVKPKTRTFFRKFLGELNRRMFLKLGFLDGTPGIIEAIYQAFSKTITYLFVYEKYKKSSSN
jgi:glycosyltransferase involved in cell wall biosynthesis